jgi:hypothetical protein
MRPIDVGIGHDNNFMIPNFINVQFFLNARPKRRDQRADLFRTLKFYQSAHVQR